jgi:hypothetical protein
MRRAKAAVCFFSRFTNTSNIVFALTVQLLLICVPFLIFSFPEVKRPGRDVNQLSHPAPRLKKE